MASDSDALSSFPLPEGVAEFLSEFWGIERFHPPQAAALPPALAGQNLVLAAPTASGKTLVAQLAIMKRLRESEQGSRAVYIVPLKALASEKVREMEEIAAPFGMKVGIGIGDRSGENRGIDDADIIICTSEKFDSLMRNRPQFLDRVSIVIADEVHLVNEFGRGPTLEVNLARIRLEVPTAQLIALSATIGNAKDVAEWLGAELVVSDWRPVPLQFATLTDLLVEVRHEVSPLPREEPLPPPRKLDGPKSNQIFTPLLETVQEGGQMLCFVGTRKSAQSLARQLSDKMKKHLERSEDEKTLKKLKKLSEKLEQVGEGSEVGDLLVKAVAGGVAFHHAGLSSRRRQIIEDAFKRGDIYCITATPTLAAGVNLPARRVLVRDLSRWDGGGSSRLPVMEVQQMMGRAGRPKYDDRGEAWIKCKNQIEADLLSEHYFKSEPEDIVSKLHMESPMRMHVLAAIATGGQSDRWSLGRFFAHTFLARDLAEETLADNIDGIVDWLCEHGMVERLGIDETLAAEVEQALAQQSSESGSESISEIDDDWDDFLPPWATAASEAAGVNLSKPEEKKREIRKGPAIIGFQSAGDIVRGRRFEAPLPERMGMRYQATPFGERVSRLYLDPLSGHLIQTAMNRALHIVAELDDSRTLSPYGILHMLSTLPDYMVLWPRKADEDLLIARRYATECEELVDRDLLRENRLDIDALAHVKTAMVVESWIEEESNRTIEKKLGAAPGDLRLRIELADWLLYAAREIVRFSDNGDEMLDQPRRLLVEMLDELRMRVANGCKSDLLGLVAVKGVGRVRARQLAGKGIRTVEDLLELTERDQRMLADQRGWSQKVVDGIMASAGRVRRASRRR